MSQKINEMMGTVTSLSSIEVTSIANIQEGHWVVINPFTPDCQIRKVVSINNSNNTLNIAPALFAVPTETVTILVQENPERNIALFGADPQNDAASNTKAIQAAIADCNLNGGSIVFFPKGVFEVCVTANDKVCFHIPTNSSLQFMGEGIEQTVLQMAATKEPKETALFYVTATHCSLQWQHMTLTTTKGYAIHCELEYKKKEQHPRSLMMDEVAFVNANNQAIYTDHAIQNLSITNCIMKGVGN